MSPHSTFIAVLAATTTAQIASSMGVAVFPVIAPRLASEMALAPATIGYLVSLAYGTAAIASTLMSFAVPRWGACRAIQIGLALCALAMLLALTASVPGLAMTAVLLGLAMTLMTPASGHLLFRFSPAQNRNLIFSIKQTGVPGGWMLMALIAPAVTLAFGWRWAIGVVLAITVATALALQRRRTHWDDDRKPEAARWVNPATGLKLLWRYPTLRWMSVASFFLTFVQLCVGTFLVNMLVEEAGYSLVAAGVMQSLVQGAGVAGRILWGWIADRTGDALGLLHKISLTVMGCCIAMAFVGPAWPTALLALFFIVFGLSAVGWNGLFLAEIAHRSPHGMVSVATSAALAWNYGGILIGPALFAATYSWSGSYAHTFGGLSVIAFLGVVGMTLSQAARRRERLCSKT